MEQRQSEWVSRGVFQLARASGFSVEQIRQLAADAGTLARLRTASPESIARVSGVPAGDAERLVHAAQLISLPGMSPATAASLARQDVTIAALAGGDLPALTKAAADIPGVTARALAGWMVPAAMRTRRGSASRRTDTKAAGGPPPALRRLVIEQEITWSRLASELYGAAKGDAPGIAARLAAANRSPVERPVVSGTIVALPVLSQGTPKLPPVGTAAAALRSFAPYLSDTDAESLVRAGVQSPAGALALLQHPAPKTTDVPSAVHLQVGQQAGLEAAGAEPSLARYLVATKPRSLDALARSNPLDLAEELAGAQALGLLGPGIDISTGAVAALLADLLVLIPGVVIWPGGMVLWPAETSVCSHPLPPNTHLENYYSTRFAPGGRSAEALTAEENAKQQWLAGVNDYLLDPLVPKPARTKAFVEAGLQLGRLAVADLERWFGTGAGLTWNFTERAMLEKLRDFMSSHLQVLQLLRLVAEGHEAFQYREYGLALAAYQRADEWFTAVCGDTIARRWWQNQANAAGDVRPGFMLPDPLFDLAVAHYDSRRTAANPDTLLETLQVDLADYHRWPLFVLRDDATELPFCRHLYYIAHFLLPVLKGDCSLRLGNFCAALDCYFQAHYEPAFTGTIDAPKDQQLAQRTRQGAAYPALFSTVFVPDEAGRYFPDFLNGVERAVIRLRVADLMIAWGDTHYRQRNNAAAEPCFAQTLRILYSTWQAIPDDATGDQAAFAAQVDQLGLNPRAVALAFTAHRELAKLAAAVNYLGYPDNYVPIWTYGFLLSSARYFGERARQAGRDALQFLASAEQEQGNRRLLLQNAAIAEAQLAVESRRADEGAAAVTLAQAGALLADQRVAHAESRQAELALYGPTRQALGVVGGAMAGAGQGAGIGGAVGGPFGQGGGAVGSLTGMPLGMAGGAFTSYLSGAIELEMQRNELDRQRLEMESAAAMAAAEVARAQIAASVARLTRHAAAAQAAFARSNVEYAQAKTLNAEFWYSTALRMADTAASLLERATGVAFLCEQAFEFMEGRRVDVIRFDYGQSDGALAADALLSDLDALEYERITGRTSKTMPVKAIVRLREKDFRAFTEMKRTGVIDFDLPLAGFDLSDPGSYHQRIAHVEVEVRALIPPEGLRGTLRKGGLSYLRYRLTGDAVPANTAPDWIVHTPTRYRLASIVQPDETLLLSPFDVRRDAVVLRADPGEQLRVFEGSGVGSTWRLSVRSPGQAVDLATLTDVDVIVYYYAQYDPALDRAVQLERRKLAGLRQLPLQRTRGFSLRESFPDELYHLHQPRPGVPADPWRARELALAVSGDLFPPNEIDRSLTGITLAALRPDGGYHELIASVSVGAQAIPAASFQSAADEPKIRSAAGAGVRPDVAWTITIQAADNPALAAAGRYQLDVNGKVAVDRSGQPIADAGGVVIFDAAKLANLADIWLIMNYGYQQGGEDAAPIALWSHFGSQAPASFVDGAFALQTAAWSLTDTRAGAPAWTRAAGWFGQRAAAAAGLVAPSASPALADAHLLADVSVPATVGAQAGIVARRGLVGAHFNGYLARVTRLNSGDSEVGIDRLDGAATVNLARVTVAGLSRLQRFELGLRARGTRLDLFVDGALLLTATDATYASGGIACYAVSAGPAFGNVLLSDLTGR